MEQISDLYGSWLNLPAIVILIRFGFINYHTSDGPLFYLAKVVEELLGGGLLRHLEDLDSRRRHRGGERLEELRQRVHLADALHLG